MSSLKPKTNPAADAADSKQARCDGRAFRVCLFGGAGLLVWITLIAHGQLTAAPADSATPLRKNSFLDRIEQAFSGKEPAASPTKKSSAGYPSSTTARRGVSSANRPATKTPSKISNPPTAKRIAPLVKETTPPPTLSDAQKLALSLASSAHKVMQAALDPNAPVEIKKRPLKVAPSGTIPDQLVSKETISSEFIATNTRSKQVINQRKKTPSVREPASGTPAPRDVALERLRMRVAQTLTTYMRRPLNTVDNTPWEVMHGFIAFGIPTKVRVGGPRGDLVNAIGWMNMAGRCRGQVMLAALDDHFIAMKGFGVQGHAAQYLAILAQSRVAKESPISIGSKSFTVMDLIREEQKSCRSNTELTFALIGLAHYLPTDETWTSRDGKKWSLEKLVEEELEQPIRGAPCGGTHRLFGLAYGCQRRRHATGTLDGAYVRAEKFVRDYQLMTLTRLQNNDGSFSTEWFKYPADRKDDIDRKIQTTGHMLEFLVGSIDQESLYNSRVTRAVTFLANALLSDPKREWKIGPMCHALHALTIYQERVWGVVLPGGVAAFHGPMKARSPNAPQLANDKKGPDSRSAKSPSSENKGTATR